jgi:hypothetical protein
MTSSMIRGLLATLAVTGVVTLAHAQQAARLETQNLALEVVAGSLVLPTGANSAAVFPPCGGCAPKSFPTRADTVYRLRRTPVTVADLKAAIVSRPDLILTVIYSVKSGELISVTADIDAPTPRRAQ